MKFAVAFVAVLALTSSAMGTPSYISPTGLDSNSCTSPSTPCFNITAAAEVGREIIAAAGTYQYVQGYPGWDVADGEWSLTGAGSDDTVFDFNDLSWADMLDAMFQVGEPDGSASIVIDGVSFANMQIEMTERGFGSAIAVNGGDVTFLDVQVLESGGDSSVIQVTASGDVFLEDFVVEACSTNSDLGLFDVAGEVEINHMVIEDSDGGALHIQAAGDIIVDSLEVLGNDASTALFDPAAGLKLTTAGELTVTYADVSGNEGDNAAGLSFSADFAEFFHVSINDNSPGAGSGALQAIAASDVDLGCVEIAFNNGYGLVLAAGSNVSVVDEVAVHTNAGGNVLVGSEELCGECNEPYGICFLPGMDEEDEEEFIVTDGDCLCAEGADEAEDGSDCECPDDDCEEWEYHECEEDEDEDEEDEDEDDFGAAGSVASSGVMISALVALALAAAAM